MVNIFKKTRQIAKINRERWFSKLTDLFERSAQGEDLWDEIEELLITADVGMDTASKLIQRVRERVKKESISGREQAHSILKDELINILQCSATGFLTQSSAQAPTVILVIGANGCGKTTSIAKLAHSIKNDGNQVMLAAAHRSRQKRLVVEKKES